ncbi:hypothetical protein CC86DRAFT_160887 [Ophiobolus disseminans]|uniref:Uncharacterized protein n=1 Tax=Ophiobolus disseminans TaxID=1469910 RepID=A0A6A7ACF2_9PLEO|nr:hypothetical protein CC86DRAFT_160887 [Ophiobolus disseminans]
MAEHRARYLGSFMLLASITNVGLPNFRLRETKKIRPRKRFHRACNSRPGAAMEKNRRFHSRSRLREAVIFHHTLLSSSTSAMCAATDITNANYQAMARRLNRCVLCRPLACEDGRIIISVFSDYSPQAPRLNIKLADACLQCRDIHG